MASIQQAMNQLVGSVSGMTAAGTYLYSQSAGYQKKQALKDISKQEEVLSAQEAQAEYAMNRNAEALRRREGRVMEPEEASRLTAEGHRAAEVQEDVMARRADLAAQAFELDPTRERYSAMREAERYGENLERSRADIEEVVAAHQSRRAQAEADALERFKTRAQILGITEEQLRIREQMLRDRKNKTEEGDVK